GDDALGGELVEVVIDHRLAVDLDGHVLAHALDGVVVEVVLLDRLLDEVGRRLLHHAPEVLAGQATPEALADVALRAADGVLLVVEDLAADLHAAVAGAVLEADLEGQLEVAVLLLAAQEGVEPGVLLGAADDGPVLDAPVLGQPLPAGE